jgi:hypothetical protein
MIRVVCVQLEDETQKWPSVSGANKGWTENCLMFNDFLASDDTPGHPQNLCFAKLNIHNYHHWILCPITTRSSQQSKSITLITPAAESWMKVRPLLAPINAQNHTGYLLDRKYEESIDELKSIAMNGC